MKPLLQWQTRFVVAVPAVFVTAFAAHTRTAMHWLCPRAGW